MHRLIISVVTAASSGVTLIDGSTSIVLLTAAATNALGVYSIEVNALSATGPWKITTGAGATVVAVGIFSA